MKSTLKTVGYSDKLSVMSGDTINFMISSEMENYSTKIEKIIDGMRDPDKNDLHTTPIKSNCEKEYKGTKQIINIGSYAELPISTDWLSQEFSVSFHLWPTIIKNKRQTIFSTICENETKFSLYINEDGYLELQAVDGQGVKDIIKSKNILEERAWCFISVGYSNITQELIMYKANTKGWMQSYKPEITSKKTNLDFSNSEVNKVWLAAEKNKNGEYKRLNHYNGKIDNPRFYKRLLSIDELNMTIKRRNSSEVKFDIKLLANYDFSKNFSSDILTDCSGNNLHGKIYQGPTRGVTGHNWSGKEIDFKITPEQYGAIHFHEDDLEDAEWETSISWKVPKEVTSGVYALKIEDGVGVDYIPFYIRPRKQQNKSPVLFLAPTNTYLAYANEQLFQGDFGRFMDHEMKIAPQDEYIVANPELGKSLYDTHTDGSGVTYSSRLRPIMNIRPHYRNWLTGTVRHLAADLYITGWLENRKQKYDVATDEDLHNEGTELLNEYKVIITGSHPEYWTREMMESLEKYLANGGKIMYLGANGFYWVTSLHPDKNYIAEVRRGNAGIRCWNSPQGEIYHSSTGEYGSLWRYNGYTPQSLVGIGMTAQGWGRGCGYKRLPDSYNPEAKFIFDGIKEDEIIGDFGYILDGAVGDELDRYDLDLGTPKHALRVATSTGLGNEYQFVIEDQLMTAPGQGGEENDLVRSDMTYFDIEGGGEVFSVGSITWAGSLAWNNYENNVAKVSDNVLNHFLKNS